MASTVVALYDDFGSANAAVRELADNGFPRNDVSLVASDMTGEFGHSVSNPDEAATNTTEGVSVGAGVGAIIGGLGGLLVGFGALAIPGIGPVVAAGPLAAAVSALAGAGIGAVAGGVSGGLIGALMDMGVPRETAEYYAEGVRRGGHLVTINTPDEMTNRAVEILNRHNPVDINERVLEWRQTGWSRFDPNAGPYRPVETGTPKDWPRSTGEMPYQSGPDAGVLPVEGATGTGPTGAMGKDAQTDWQGTSTPQNADQRLETGAGSVQESADVSQSIAGNSDFSAYDTDFRQHFANGMYASQYNYDQFRPAYHYGYDLARDVRYRDESWDQIEPEARQRWDQSNPGTWERVKDSVQYAWQEIKNSSG